MNFGYALGSFTGGLFEGAKDMNALRNQAEDLQTKMISNQMLRAAAEKALQAGNQPPTALPTGTATQPSSTGYDSPDDMGSEGYGGGSGAAPGGVGASGPAGLTQDLINQASAKYGFGDSTLPMTTASIESGFGTDPNTNNPGKKYRGIYQLGDDEWNEMGGGDRNDINLQIDHGVGLLAKRKQQLEQALGRPVQDWEVYLAHNQGVAGATYLLNNPNAPAAGGPIAPANISSNFGGNPNAPASTFTAAVQNTYNRRMGGLPKLAAGQGTYAPMIPNGVPTADYPVGPADYPIGPSGTPTTALASTGTTPSGRTVNMTNPAPQNTPGPQSAYDPTPDPLGAPTTWHPYGDSIAGGFITHAGFPGVVSNDASDTTAPAANGRNPQTSLAAFKKIPDGALIGPDGRGQDVLLSSSASNGAGQVGLLDQQIKELKRAGAGRIRVLGVGNRAGYEGGHYYNLAPLNPQLQRIARSNGAEWGGELDTVVHPSRYELKGS